MITTRDAALLFEGKGLLTNEMIINLVMAKTGSRIGSARIHQIKQKIKKNGYIKSNVEWIDGRMLIEVLEVGNKQYNKNKRLTNKLKAHYRKHGKKHTYKYYGEKFGLTTGCAYHCWREVESEMPPALYQASETMKLINKVFR